MEVFRGALRLDAPQAQSLSPCLSGAKTAADLLVGGCTFIDANLGVDDDGADFCHFLAVVGNGVTGAGRADHHITDTEGALSAIVIVKDIALHDVEQFAFTLVDVITDAAHVFIVNGFEICCFFDHVHDLLMYLTSL